MIEIDKNEIADKSLLSSIFSYLINPSYDIKPSQQKALTKFKDIFKLWSFSFFITLILGLVASFIISATGYNIVEHSAVVEFLQKPWYLVIFFIFLWAPLTEELTFRLGLKFSPYRLSFTIAFLALVFLNIIFLIFSGLLQLLADWLFNFTKIAGLIFYFSFVIIIGLALGRLFKKRLNTIKAAKIYRKHFRLIFYFAASLFALVHIFNYFNLEQIWFLIILLVVPQFIIALLLGYVRMNYGLVWSMITHLLHNGLITLPIIIVNFLPDDLIRAAQNNQSDRLTNLTGAETIIILAVFIIVIVILLTMIIALVSLFREFFRMRKQTV